MQITRREFLKATGYAAVFLVLAPESAYGSFKPTSESIERGDRSQKKIALTFDGIETNNALPYILKSMEQYGPFSTFFLTGNSIARFPDMAKMIYDCGHEIGNHTYNHQHLTTYWENGRHDTRKGVDKKFVQDQLLRTNEEFHNVCGKDMAPLWRAPFGEENGGIREWAKEAGYQHVRWTFDTRDWVRDEKDMLYLSPKAVAEKLLKLDEKDGLNGYIILMHTGTQRKKEPFHEELPLLMGRLQEKGYMFAKVSDIL